MSATNATTGWELLRCVGCGYERTRAHRDGQLALPCVRCAGEMIRFDLTIAGEAPARDAEPGSFSVFDAYTALRYAADAVRERAQQTDDPIAQMVLDARADAFATAVEMLQALTAPELTAAIADAGLEVRREPDGATP